MRPTIVVGWAIGIAILLQTDAARSDFDTARLAIKKNDYVTAAAEFRKAAELGHPLAQFNLGALYESGNGVERDFALAFAWMYVAADNGLGDTKPALQRVATQLRDNPAAVETAKQYRALYGKEAITRKFTSAGDAPQSGPDRTNMSRSDIGVVIGSTDLELVHGVGIVFRKRGCYSRPDLHTGTDVGVPLALNITASFLVVRQHLDARGGVREADDLLVYPRLRMDEELYKCLLTDGLSEVPADMPGGLISAYVSLGANTADIRPEATLARIGTRILPCAVDDSPDCQYLAALLPFTDEQRGMSAPSMLLRAAQGGSVAAQYVYGQYYANAGNSAAPATEQQLNWLRLAAENGSNPARVALARVSVTNRETADWQGARKLLEKARAGNERRAVLPLAALLAASPDDKVRDPKAAVALLDKWNYLHQVNPSFWEIRAAAAAALGDFKLAKKHQQKAIDRAKALYWGTTSLDERMQSYSEAKPWVGDLLAL